MNLAKIIKTTIEKKTPNRSYLKEWEKFLYYCACKELGHDYDMYDDAGYGAEIKERCKKEDIEKFEKWIKKYEE